MSIKKTLLASLAFGPLAVLADDPTPSYTVPAAVTGAVEELKGAATGLAGEALPAIVKIGVPFIGIAVIFLLFRVFRKFAGGR